MRKRIWKIHTDSYHRTMRGMKGRYTLMSGSETHVRYMWGGKAANIHGTTIICRERAWLTLKSWVRLIARWTKIWA